MAQSVNLTEKRAETVNVNLFRQFAKCEEELAATSEQEVLNKTHEINVLKSDQNYRFSKLTKEKYF